MQTSMKLLLTAPPDQCRAALRFGLPVAHVAYRVGGGPHLFRASIPVSVRGGLMVIDNTGFDGRGEAGPFCQEVLRECMARGYDGILCDFEGHPLQVLAQAVRTLGELTKKRGWPLYVTEAYAPFSDSAIALIPSALSGGSLQQRLQEAVERFGAARVALAVERVAEDFFLPSPTGQGMPLTREELRQRLGGTGSVGVLLQRAVRPLLHLHVPAERGPLRSVRRRRLHPQEAPGGPQSGHLQRRAGLSSGG